MQKIDGIELADLVTETENEVLAEKRAAIRKQVSGILLNKANWEYLEKKALAEAKKYREKIEKAAAKLKQIREGDWSILEDEKKEGEKGKSQAPADDD